MRIIFLRCGTAPLPTLPPSVEVLEVSTVPTRQELKALDTAAKEILPIDPTPSVDEIMRQPDVRHLGTPGPAPQKVPQALRVIVAGDDSALSAVLTRLMRADSMWVEVAFLPVDDQSAAARNWGIDKRNALTIALDGTVRPMPLIRSDKGIVVAGSASITEWDDTDFTGEIVVDSTTLVRHQGHGEKSREGVFGARLVPMLDAPGIAGVAVTTSADPEQPRGFFGRFRRPLDASRLDHSSLSIGRALQAGGPQLKVIIDGSIPRRPVKRVAFYRHLRDLQSVRP